MNETTNLWIYDIEVFTHDWIVIFHSLETGEKEIFHNANYAVACFIDDNAPMVAGGYNSKNYDQWILKAIYHGADNATVKELNDFIVRDGMRGWNFLFLLHKTHPIKNFDLMDDLGSGLFIRLKEIEGNLGMSIEESSVPFDIDRPLTEAEVNEVIKYCAHDVDATVRLYRERKDYLSAKIKLGAMKGLGAGESLNLTNAKLTARYLDAKYYDRGDEFVYNAPGNLVIKKYPQVLDFFANIDREYKRNLNIDIAGAPHTIAWGGLHGALECHSEKRTETRKLTHLDVTSYYPSLMIVNGYLSRSAPDPEEFKAVYEKRIAAKSSGDKATADALKLVLNTTYGAMKNPYNALYDPRMANAVCISGQLYLVDLIEKLERVPNFRLIQSNTDGLIVSYDEIFEETIKSIVAEWSARTGFKMGFDELDQIVQKDVNNYVVRRADGTIDPGDDLKGAYVVNYGGGDFKNKSLVIVAKAVVAYLLDGVPPADTINACDEVWQFQMIAKAGSTYDGVVWQCGDDDIPVQNVNRVYASSIEMLGTVYKLKTKEGRRDKIANLPERCIIDNANELSVTDIDKQFYIDMAQKRINDYLGIKPEKIKKERKKRMATTTKKTEAAETQAATEKSLYEKLFELQTIMDGYSWTKDGVNRRQSYDYITEKQYKNNFKAARAAVGLLWKMEEVGHEFLGAVSDKMHLIITNFRGRLIDPATGDYEEYLFSGSGADGGDKALYKAYTGGLKFFLASNFLVAEENDPESDEEDNRREKPRYTSPEKREEIKKKLEDDGDDPATEEQLEAIALGIALLEDEGCDSDMIAAFTDLLDTDLTKASAEETIDAINDLLPEGAA
jgi:hypothetical protein